MKKKLVNLIKVGITGEMGSGKSYCSKIFEQMGVPVFYSDDVARKIINSNLSLKREICKEFGNIYDEDGLIIPSLIRSIVFVEGAEDKLKKLNDLAHPYVLKEFEIFCQKHSDKKYILAESAILYEYGMNKVVDKTIYVKTNEETRIERTFKRSGFGREEYKQRMKNQIPNKEKIANFVIFNNDGDDLIKQINEIDQKLKSNNFF
jgi:dephospho-CoA kinase